MQSKIPQQMNQHMKDMRRFDSNPLQARFMRAAKHLRRALEEGIMPWNPRARYRDVFLLGGITHVPRHEFPEHIDFFMAMTNMLRFRYDLNPQFALLDNEASLDMLPREIRPFACYAQDQACAQNSDFLIADLSVPSTGTGQELERARQAGVPVIAMAKREIREEVTPSVLYEAVLSCGKTVFKEVQRGVSSISMMVEGNPALRSFFPYSNNGHVGRTDALVELDKRVSDLFGLRSAGVDVLNAMSEVSEFEAALRAGSAGKRAIRRFISNERMHLHSQTLAFEKDIDPALNDGARLDAIRSLLALQEALDKAELARKSGETLKMLKGPISHRLKFSSEQMKALDELLVFPHAHSTFHYQRLFPDNKRMPLVDSVRGNLEPEVIEVHAIRNETAAVVEEAARIASARPGES